MALHALDAIQTMNHVALHTPSRLLFQERLDHRFNDFRGGFVFTQAANAELGPGFPIQGEGGFDFGDGITVYPYGRQSLYTFAMKRLSLYLKGGTGIIFLSAPEIEGMQATPADESRNEQPTAQRRFNFYNHTK
jgi:hypothetical protein